MEKKRTRTFSTRKNEGGKFGENKKMDVFLMKKEIQIEKEASFISVLVVARNKLIEEKYFL